MSLEQRNSDCSSGASSRQIDLILTQLAFGKYKFECIKNQKLLKIDVLLKGGELSLEFKNCELVLGTIKLGVFPVEFTITETSTITSGGTLSVSGLTGSVTQTTTGTISKKFTSDFAKYQPPVAQPSWRFEGLPTLDMYSPLQNLEIATLRINNNAAAGSFVTAFFKVEPKDIVTSDVEERKAGWDPIQYLMAKVARNKYYKKYDDKYDDLVDSKLQPYLSRICITL